MIFESLLDKPFTYALGNHDHRAQGLHLLILEDFRRDVVKLMLLWVCQCDQGIGDSRVQAPALEEELSHIRRRIFLDC